MHKGLSGLRPTNLEDEEKLKSLPTDWEGYVTLKYPRNLKFHKKYFALIELGFDNQDRYKSKDHYRKLMQMKAGFYEVVKTDKGLLPLPLSISFDSMEEYEFQDLYNRVIEQIALNLGLGDDILKREVEEKLNGFY
jgi:hypothetical protein